MPFVPQPLGGFHSIECFYNKFGIALRQGTAFVVIPKWKLASILSESLYGRTSYSGSYGLSLSDKELDAMQDLTKLASMTDEERRDHDAKIRGAHYDEARQVDIHNLRDMESALIKQWQASGGNQEVKDIQKKMIDECMARINQLEKLQNGVIDDDA